ncbi:MAG: hypothetical protein L7U72_13435 [Rubripirellula sp.]|nr:hypothetical protein [Rubripirellula sp.]
MQIKTILLGGAFLVAPKTGFIDSKNGKAMEMPDAFSSVRRLSGLFMELL